MIGCYDLGWPIWSSRYFCWSINAEVVNATRVEGWSLLNQVWRHLQCQLMLLANSFTWIWFIGRMNICIDLLLVIMQNLCSHLLLVLVSAGISISLLITFAISFYIILYSIVNIMSFFLSCRYFPAKFMYHSYYTVIFWVVLFDKYCCLSLYLFKNWDIFYLVWLLDHYISASMLFTGRQITTLASTMAVSSLHKY